MHASPDPAGHDHPPGSGHRHDHAHAADAHDRGHSHGHAHGHHHHAPARHDAAFAIGTALNAAYVAVQIGCGLAAGSMALLADGVHNLGDVFGLVLSWGAVWLARRRPTARRTYGWGRGTILASLANAVVLLVSIGAIAAEAVRRLLHPAPVPALTVLVVAAIGIAVNGFTAMLFARGRKGDLNIRATFVHMAADAAVSGGVVLAAALIMLTGASWLDPLCSLLIAATIAWSSWGLLRESADLAMDAVPEHLRAGEIDGYLRSLPGVVEVHDLHVWGLSTTDTALTAHLVHDGDDAGLVRAACDGLRTRFGIGHCTFQVETGALAALCELRCGDMV